VESFNGGSAFYECPDWVGELPILGKAGTESLGVFRVGRRNEGVD
jgi:hypothetical protein